MKIKIQKQLSNFLLDVDIDTDAKFIGLLGSSGSGKSMMLKCLAGIETPDIGEIILDNKILYSSDIGINIPSRERKIGYLFQNYALFENMTVFENIKISMADKSENPELYIKKFRLFGLENKFPNQISGGQKQRVALARIFASKPDILLLDEPFSALDSTLKNEIEQEIIDDLKEFDGKVIIVSHNPDEIYRMSEELCFSVLGETKLVGKTKDIFKNPQRACYAKLMGFENILSKNEYIKLFLDEIDSNFVSVPSKSMVIHDSGIEFFIKSKVENREYNSYLLERENIKIIFNTNEVLDKKVYIKVQKSQIIEIKKP